MMKGAYCGNCGWAARGGLVIIGLAPICCPQCDHPGVYCACGKPFAHVGRCAGEGGTAGRRHPWRGQKNRLTKPG